jgi:hypothetical protein
MAGSLKKNSKTPKTPSPSPRSLEQSPEPLLTPTVSNKLSNLIHQSQSKIIEPIIKPNIVEYPLDSELSRIDDNVSGEIEILLCIYRINNSPPTKPFLDFFLTEYENEYIFPSTKITIDNGNSFFAITPTNKEKTPFSKKCFEYLQEVTGLNDFIKSQYELYIDSESRDGVETIYKGYKIYNDKYIVVFDGSSFDSLYSPLHITYKSLPLIKTTTKENETTEITANEGIGSFVDYVSSMIYSPKTPEKNDSKNSEKVKFTSNTFEKPEKKTLKSEKGELFQTNENSKNIQEKTEEKGELFQTNENSKKKDQEIQEKEKFTSNTFEKPEKETLKSEKGELFQTNENSKNIQEKTEEKTEEKEGVSETIENLDSIKIKPFIWCIIDELMNKKEILKKTISPTVPIMLYNNSFLLNIFNESGEPYVKPLLLYMCIDKDKDKYNNLYYNADKTIIHQIREQTYMKIPPITYHKIFGPCYLFSTNPLLSDESEESKEKIQFIKRFAVFDNKIHYLLGTIKDQVLNITKFTESNNIRSIRFNNGETESEKQELWAIKQKSDFVEL